MACSNESTHTNDFTSNKLGALYSFSDLTEGEELADESFVVKQMLVPPPLKKEDQKIIKTAHLRFETQGLENTHKKILASTKALNGFVSTDNSGKNYNEYFRNITIRIPTENFQKFIDDISKGVNYFDQKDISRRDVSEEFVDLNARLKAKRELEKRYLELLTQARNVKEILEIERELSQIREEIEAKQGRLNYLKDKVSLSTINIQFYKYTHETGVTVSYGQKIKNALSGGWDGISVFFIGLLYLWPLLLFMMIIILLIRRWMKRKKRKAQKTK
ncbi:MAG: DUF4349 domain-containing protein [Flavobacteriaceae bacterium]|nr:DUF4349 domain-containing protein [Flavobacteriaceae bacterium]